MTLWKIRASLSDKAKSFLLRTHGLWSKVLPEFYYPYGFRGGYIYLNVKESKMMLERVLDQYEIPKYKGLEKVLSQGGVFLDIGANKGDFSLFAARILGSSGRILAFEPAPENCKWIRKSIEKNGYNNIEIFDIALSDENSEATLYIGEMSGWHSLISRQAETDMGKIRVVTRRLDDVLAEKGFNQRIDAIKIDVEGADMHVLRGARETLIKNKGVTLFLDFHQDLGVDPVEVQRFLANLGFSLFEESPPLERELQSLDGVTSLVAARV